MHDSRFDDLSERQHSLVARWQAREMGLSQSSITWMWRRSPMWETVTDQVVRRVGSPQTTAQQILAAVLDAGGDAVVSDVSAMRWWGHRGSSLQPIRLVTTRGSRRRTALATTRRVSRIESHWTTTLDDVPIVRPEMLAMQMFDVWGPERAERLVDWLWAERLLSGPSVRRFLIDLGERGRNGTAGLRAYLDRRPDDYVPPASGLESRAMQLFAEAGIPMRRQVDSGAEHWTGRVDFRHESEPVVVEIQSERHHSALVDTEADALRQAQLERDGFEVVELTDVDVWARPASVGIKTWAGIERRRSPTWPDDPT